MRLFVVSVASLVLASSAAAQSRWTFSAGPEWTRFPGARFYGGRLRAEYDLLKPTSPLRLRLETSGFWSPTQNFYGSYTLVDGTFGGSKQSFDLGVGFSAALTPLPKARFSPYIVMAAVARQSWTRQFGWRQFTGSPIQYYGGTGSLGEVLLQPGIGIRARLGGRVFQLEWRRYDHRSLTLGTHLPF